MISLRLMRRDERGSAVVETAFALPVLIVLLWVIVQMGLIFRAMAGIQHALGEGAREAVLFPYPDPSENDNIKDKMVAAVYGIGPGTFEEPSVVEGEEDGIAYVDLSVTYEQETNLIFLPGPTINVTRSKRVWVAEAE
jgi:hypothetical protein